MTTVLTKKISEKINLFKMENLIENDSLGQFINSHTNIFRFLMSTAKQAISNRKYLTPNPCEIIGASEITLERFKIIDIELIINFFKNGRKDREFIKNKEGEEMLRLLYFFVFFTDYSLTEIHEDENYYYTKINLVQDDDEDFVGEVLLFHGTRNECLYSILRNSLKSMSGTSFMTNGAASGNGIYLSESFAIAGTYMRQDGAVLVCSVRNLNKVSDLIFVQQDPDVKLVGIIIPKIKVTTGSLLMSTTKNHLKFFRNEIMIETNSPRVMRSRRFIKEMDRIINKQTPGILRIVFQSENEPFLFYISPAEDSNLKKDCETYGLNGIVLSMSFPEKANHDEEYPMSAPLVRVLKPIFKRSTGRVSEGGSICLDSVFSTGWNPHLGIEQLVLSIIDIISNESQENSTEKGGRIDAERLDEEYSFQDFLRSLHNTAVIHKWSI